MVSKNKSTNEKKRGTVQVGKLSLSKETIKDLSPKEKSRIKGGATAQTPKCNSDVCSIGICRP